MWDLTGTSRPTVERLTDWAAGLTKEIGGSLHPMNTWLLLLSPVRIERCRTVYAGGVILEPFRRPRV